MSKGTKLDGRDGYTRVVGPADLVPFFAFSGVDILFRALAGDRN